MGCFNLKGFLSNVSIQYGDEIVMMIGLQKKANTRQYYTCGSIVPLTLPIYGKYDDYGGIESVEDTPTAKWIEEHLGKIEDVMEAVGECMDEYRPTVGECISSDNECHPETHVRYVYDNLLKLSPRHIKESSHLCLLVEHRSVYEKYAIPMNSDEFHSIDSIVSEESERIKTLNRLGIKRSIFDDFSHIQRIFGNDSYGALSIMIGNGNGDKFLLDNIDEVKRLQGFIRNMEGLGRSIQVPMQYSQEDYFAEDLEYHKMCIDLVKRLKKEHRW